MPQPTEPRITKTMFMAGLQCRKRFWLETNQPLLADPVAGEVMAVIDQGLRVGAFARTLYPEGRLVTHVELPHDDVVAETRSLLTDPTVGALFEAGFEADGLAVRTDILERNDDGTFDLVEVKAVARPGPAEIRDMAYQVMVLERAGLTVRAAVLLHPDGEYVMDAAGPDAAGLFQRTDVTAMVRAEVALVDKEAEALAAVAQAASPPPEPIGPQCGKPVGCPFHSHCHRTVGPEHVENIAHISNKLRLQLRAAGIDDIRSIPNDWELSKHQQRWVDMVKSGQPVRDDAGIAAALGGLRFPVHFFDFEAIGPAIPLWPGRAPYEWAPFQFSDHVLHEDGRIEHRGHLHRSPLDDPDEAMLEAQFRTLGDEGSIIAFSAYEVQRWRDYARRHPAWASYMQELEDRYVDLHPIIKKDFAHPQLRGSYSLKAIYRVLLPGLSYDDLAIQNGGQAVVAYTELLDAERRALAGDEEARARADQLAHDLDLYCGRDTQAMHELVFELVPELGRLAERHQAHDRRPSRGPRR